jgi:hypothetical protein
MSLHLNPTDRTVAVAIGQQSVDGASRQRRRRMN